MSDGRVRKSSGGERLAKLKHVVKEGKGKVGSLSSRDVEHSKELSVSRAGNASVKGRGEDNGGSLHSREVDTGIKFGKIDYKILEFAPTMKEINANVKQVERHEGRRPVKLSSKQKLQLSRASVPALQKQSLEIAAFSNAGGIEIYKRVASHYGVLAENTDDAKQKAFYEGLSSEYINKIELLNLKKKEVDATLKSATFGYKATSMRTFLGEVDEKTMGRIDFLTKVLIEETDEMVLKATGNMNRPRENFSNEFSGELFDWYARPVATDDIDRVSPYITPNGENMLICGVAYADLNRSDYVLIDRGGKRIMLSAKTFPHFSDEEEEKLRKEARSEGKREKEISSLIEARKKEVKKKQEDWKREMVNEFLKFCGYDQNAKFENDEARAKAKKLAEEKLFKLSQCMCQHMGFGYGDTSGTSQNAPQRIAGKSFSVPDNAGDLKRHFELRQERDGSITLKSIDEIENINYIIRDGSMIATNPEGTSLNLEVGVVLNGKNEWEEYQGGGVGFEVSAVKTDDNMKSLLK